jgi:hypothetical protein
MTENSAVGIDDELMWYGAHCQVHGASSREAYAVAMSINQRLADRPNCRSCQHWTPDMATAADGSESLGECLIDPTTSGLLTIASIDGAEFLNRKFTRPDFGCTDWAAALTTSTVTTDPAMEVDITTPRNVTESDTVRSET